jgi:U1 small nuclear ribonucleoprotein C
MGRFYCDYCHCYLTYDPPSKNNNPLLTSRHDSASVRKAHNLGRNHLQQVREYYQKLGFEKTQSVIDSLTQDYQSQAVASAPNPFAPAGLPGIPAGGFGGNYQSMYHNNIAARPGFAPMGGMSFGGPGGFGQPPLPGMPLPPPPGMPLPGGQTAPAPPGMPGLPGMMPPFGQFPPAMGGVPQPMSSNPGGRMEQ